MDEKNLILNNFVTQNNNAEKALSLSFIAKDIKQNWEKISNLVSLIARYNTVDLDKMFYERTSFVINELIENAIKFSKTKSSTISIETLQNKDKIFIKMTNEVSPKKWESFKQVYSELKTQNLTNLLRKRITNLQTNLQGPGIGLILLKKDYTDDVQFLFYKVDNGKMYVSVIVEIDIN